MCKGCQNGHLLSRDSCLKVSTSKYPKVEVINDRIFMQSVPGGVKKRVYLGMAKYINNRLTRAIEYVEGVG